MGEINANPHFSNEHHQVLGTIVDTNNDGSLTLKTVFLWVIRIRILHGITEHIPELKLQFDIFVPDSVQRN